MRHDPMPPKHFRECDLQARPATALPSAHRSARCRTWLGVGAVAAAAWLGCVPLAEAADTAANVAPPPSHASLKTLRYAFPIAETGFDPAQINDLYSATICAHIFDAPYTYDYLARPFLIRPNTAAAMPESADDFKTWTIRLKPGVYFSDDLVFKGRKRELVAQDYVYSIKRLFDPALKSPRYSGFSEEKILGLEALRDAALKTQKPFDYNKEIEGLRAIDRYTLQVKLAQPRPRFVYRLTHSGIVGAVAREVIEGYPGLSMEHPVGTGPFRLSSWRRNSKMVLDRNPNFRDEFYDAQPNADDAEGQALLLRLKGRRLPMVDRVEIGVIEEAQPRWLAFYNRDFDLMFGLPPEFANLVVPHGHIAPHLAKRGVQLHRSLGADRAYMYFNMEDPLVGGYTADKVALRRALALASDVQREIDIIRRGQAIRAQTIMSPHTYGYDPVARTENGVYDLARAEALLDLYGYIDRDGDGWRDQPNGQPLILQYASQPSSTDRQYDELWKRDMNAVHLRTEFKVAKWPEQLKKARAGQLMMWMLAQSAESPDVLDGFEMVYGPAAGGQNLARFKLPQFDALYERLQTLSDSPERLALVAEANKLLTAYMPQKYNVNRIQNDLAQPWLIGYRRPPFANRFWQFVDIDDSRRPAP